jgi:hypothetical protein
MIDLQVRWVSLGLLLWILLILSPLAHAQAPASCTALLSPSTCYQRYLLAIQQAVRLQELHPFLSNGRVQFLEKGLANAKAAGADPVQIEQVTLQTLQRAARTPNRIREQRFEREASLLVDRTGVTVEVRLVIEAGTWRIADERFRAAPRF